MKKNKLVLYTLILIVLVSSIIAYAYKGKLNKDEDNGLCDFESILNNGETNHSSSFKKLSGDLYGFLEDENDEFGYLYFTLTINIEGLGEVESLWELFGK